MGIHQALGEVGARTETAARWTRRALERRPTGSQWGAVDLAYGRSLAGSAAAVRSVLDLPPAFPARGAVGGAGGHFMGALRSLAGPRRTRAGRELRRRLVHRGKKGGRSHWSDALRQREQDHGNRGLPWSSCRRRGYKRFAE